MTTLSHLDSSEPSRWNMIRLSAVPASTISHFEVQGSAAMRLGTLFWLTGVAISIFPVSLLADEAPAPALPEQVEASGKNWALTFESEVRHFVWDSERGMPTGTAVTPGHGSQTYVPFAGQLAVQPTDILKIELLGRGGWVDAEQTTAGYSGSISTFLDSQYSATIMLLASGIQPFASFSMNAPTGKASLSPNEIYARMDPDLVEIASYGEGWNFGGTVGFNLPITSSAMISASYGYTDRGAFWRDSSPSPTTLPPEEVKLDPGEVHTFTVSAGYTQDSFAALISGIISSETDTLVDGERSFRSGRTYSATATLAYGWSESLGTTTLNGAYSHVEKNKVLFVPVGGVPPSYFETEPFNTNSNIYRVTLEHTFSLGSISGGPFFSYLYRDNNGYDSDSLQFVPAKERWSVGATAQYAVSNNLSFRARVERVWTDESASYGDNPYSYYTDSIIPIPGVPQVSSDGWQFAFGGSMNF